MPNATPRAGARVSRRAVLRSSLAAAGLLATAASPRPAGRPAAGVDTLDFFLRKQPAGLTGAHLLVQAVDLANRRSVYLKGDARHYEVHAWDETAIYLLLDRDPRQAYHLTPGVWLSRRMAVGDELVVSGDGTIAWYSGACAWRRSAPYSYTIKLERHDPDFAAGGDLGRQEVIVVRYLPAGGFAERFYYSRAWGWIGWEDYDADGQLRDRALFNQIVPARLVPAISVACTRLLGQG